MKRFLFLLLVGCNQPAQPQPPIAEAWQARCGNCHARVEPGTRTRAELDAAFQRHKARTRLTKEEWQQMADFLASDSQEAHR